MDPYNPNNLNPNPNANPNPNPNANAFSVPGYYLTMDPSWSSSQFSLNTFSGFQQTPNAFSQMSQVQSMQQMKSLQQMMLQNPFNSQFQSQPQPSPTPVESSPQPQPLEDEVEECVPETQPHSSKWKKRKQVAREAGDKDQSSRAKSKPWRKFKEEA
ncbi:hypothetical protein HanRHA438_Chr09g0385431 [Helianthus annuus]|nr:hypothetical protein HanIR_Chr09g0402931 [Helianthus annuus]KAJ0886970.1 hypothetical protein HanRHA438_Chr09g0385431 [Helianthus annuus]